MKIAILKENIKINGFPRRVWEPVYVPDDFDERLCLKVILADDIQKNGELKINTFGVKEYSF